MGMSWDNTLAAGLERVASQAFDLSQDAQAGAEVIFGESQKLIPKESGHLAESGKVMGYRGGRNTATITYDGPYARWIHEHLHFKHPHGGQAKFLETAMVVKGEEAINEAGRHFWERL